MKRFLVYQMRYTGGPCSTADQLPTLRERDMETYISLYNEAFREMRTALECAPTDFYYSREQLQEKQDSIYVLREGGALVGSVAIYGNEIDDLFVALPYQGRGYGKRLLQFAVSALQSRHAECITLSVVDWNHRAVELYRSFGFETCNTLTVGDRISE